MTVETDHRQSRPVLSWGLPFSAKPTLPAIPETGGDPGWGHGGEGEAPAEPEGAGSAGASPSPSGQIHDHRPETKPARGGWWWRWFVLVLLSTIVVWAHGCHGEEDDDLAFMVGNQRHAPKVEE